MRRSPALALLTAVLAALAFVSAALADPNNNNSAKLRNAVTLEGVRAHQLALQQIANANGGNRFSGFAGHDASVAYVVDKLEAAGYDPVVQPFVYTAFFQVGPSTLAQTAPGSVTYVEHVDYQLMDQTDPGNVTAAVTAVDLQLGPGNTSTSGCEAADFAGFPAGNIALLQRGACTFQQKAENAAAAGASGAIIFNQGNTPARTGLIGGTLSAAYSGGIPVLDATYDRGVEWAGTAGLVMHLVADVTRRPATTYNVLAELPGKNSDNVVMVGAHLDSVSAGPGINDNGSGSAAILEVAEQMEKVKPWNTVRFAWWGAEESVLLGSTFYVNSLSATELDRIALYLNFDMVGSPNFVRFVYDGSGNIGPIGPEGSAEIEAVFHDYFEANGLASEPTAFDGRSDYQAFINNGIPAGGLFTGAEGIKTPSQAATYGGTAGVAYDPCYHQACDTFDNNNSVALDQMSDAIAHATITFAQNTSLVNGVPGKGNFNTPEKINGQAVR
jgi:Zn-dependent M28 family amino/carboxypeptidase